MPGRRVRPVPWSSKASECATSVLRRRSWVLGVSECPTGVLGRRSWVLEASAGPTGVLGQRSRNVGSFQYLMERSRQTEAQERAKGREIENSLPP